MSDLINKIDEKTKLAGANKLEALTFTLGTDSRSGRKETFAINVFKVREVIQTPPITAAPEMPPSVKGMVSLRGSLIPVIDLAEYVGVESEGPREVMILTEFNGKTQGFLVHGVDTILRISWADMKVPPAMISGTLRGMVTAVTELADKTLVMMLDVERLLSELSPNEADELSFSSIQRISSDAFVFYADDSSVARKQIQKTLDALGVRSACACNGRDAWEFLSKMASSCQSGGGTLRDQLHLILTDIEMPEMDGFALTKKIKADGRFAGVPVFMHSSLSGVQNQQLGKSVGVDEFVSKFEPQRLAEAIKRRILRGQ